MNYRDLINGNLELGHFLLNAHLADFQDDEIFKRPVPNANSAAWQLGHLISSTQGMITFFDPQLAPELPADFGSRYTKLTASENDPLKFHTKAEYLDLFAKQKNAVKQFIERCSESDLDKPAPEKIRAYAPTIGAMLMLCGSHITMHIGQVAVLRRALGKPNIM